MKNIKIIIVALFALPLFYSCGGGDDTKVEVNEKLLLQPGAEGKDAVINKNLSTLNYGDSTDLFLSTANVNGRTEVTRILMDFNLRPINEHAVVDSAYLYLYYDKTTKKGEHTGATTFQLKRINKNWKEKEVNWQNQPSTTNTNIVVVDAHTSGTQNFERINVTKLVQEMVDEQGFTWGFLLKFKLEDLGKKIILASSDHANAKLHPKLDVYYTYFK